MKIKLLGALMIVFGVFLFAGTTSASTANILQPAGATSSFESLRVGISGQGGVTFFNGTVLNEGDDPFTVGDDMRVDGELYRIQKGQDPIKISDNIIPTLSNTNDFGSPDNYWRKAYFLATWANSTNARHFVITADPFLPGAHRKGTIMGSGDGVYINSEISDGKVVITADNGVEVSPRLKLSNITNRPVPDCDSSREGEVYYNKNSKNFFGCNGTSWKQLDN